MRNLNFNFIVLLFISLFISCQSDDVIETRGELSLTGQAPELIKLRSDTTVELRNGEYFWQEDIVLSKAQLEL